MAQMPKRIRPRGPDRGALKFQPTHNLNDPPDQIAEALDHIAVALCAISHNLEVLTRHIVDPAKDGRKRSL